MAPEASEHGSSGVRRTRLYAPAHRSNFEPRPDERCPVHLTLQLSFELDTGKEEKAPDSCWVEEWPEALIGSPVPNPPPPLSDD